MNKGLGEEKVMGPMYPRPHVNDTEKGGPRAPPRRSTMHMIEDDSANTNNLLPRITKKILARLEDLIHCITEVNGESKHFFVATQDTDLRRYLQKISGIPLIYALRNALFLEQPSPFPHQFVKSVEEEHLYMTDMKYNDNAKHKDMWCGNYLSNSIKSGIPHDARSYIVDVRKGRMRIRMGAALALDVVVLCIGIGWLLCILGSLVG
ncbi:hypothetical protein FXO38_34320 [Capsicum annuum]|nr:hypothetical protein FXO38_34320 [Capsicum annuum]KAF3617566.1 hypothetical protein FXO37_34580 [Capsicum annuum]